MFFKKLEQVQVAVEKVFAGFSAIVITALMLLTTVDVILRYIFNNPLPGAFTLCEMMMLGAIYPALAYVQQTKGNVRVDIVIERLQGAPRRSFELGTLLLALIAFGIMFWQSGILTREAWVSGDFAMGEVSYPYWPSKMVMTLGIGLLCLRIMTDIKNYFLELKKSGGRWIAWLLVSFLPLAAFFIFFISITPGKVQPVTMGWLMLAAMTVVLFMGLPIAFGLLFVAILGYWAVAGPVKTLSVLGIIPYDRVSNYTLSVIPLFILLGHLAYQGGFATSMYNTCQKWLGHLPGSMAQATIVGGAAFGAACGAGVASCATLSKICIPIMRKHGIDDKMALGCVGAVGGLAALIPPSIMMVIFAMITYQSAAKLLIAGVIPGIFAALCFMVLVYIMVKWNPKLAPPLKEKITWRDRFLSLKDSWGIGVLGFTIIGGILTGVFTPTEAGATGAAGAFLLGLVTRRLTFKNFLEAVFDTTKTTGMIFLIIASAMVLANFLGISRIPNEVSEFIMNLQIHRSFVLAGVFILYIIAGCFMDMTSFMFLTMPIIFPIMMKLGYNPLWFGVTIVVLCELALITPPFGMNLFILRAMVPGIKMGDVIRGSFPFMITYIAIVILMSFMPQLATWLPSFM